MSLGRTLEATAAFERAMRINPNVPGVVYNLALLRTQAGDRSAAALQARLPVVAGKTEGFSLLRARYLQAPDQPETTFPLVQAERRAGLYSAALFRLRKLLARNPAELQALQLYQQIDRESRAGYPEYLRPGPGISLVTR